MTEQNHHHDGLKIRDVTCFSGKRHSQKDQLKHDYVGDINMSELVEDTDLEYNPDYDDSPSDYAQNDDWRAYA